MSRKGKMDLKEKSYLYIKEKIITGELKPGESISEDELQEEMGVSRTPIREALMKLENDRLVNIYPRKGIFVSNITAKTIKEVFQIREIIEPKALEIGKDNISKEWLLDIKDKFENVPDELKTELDIKNYYVELDKNLHTYIIDMCRNTFLSDVMTNIWYQNQRMRILTFNMEKRNDVSNQEHIDIINFLLDDEFEKAKGALLSHLSKSEEVAFKYIEV
ncbi:GntR family transcriptional regulator [Clostridium sp. DL1XJH146]